MRDKWCSLIHNSFKSCIYCSSIKCISQLYKKKRKIRIASRYVVCWVGSMSQYQAITRFIQHFSGKHNWLSHYCLEHSITNYKIPQVWFIYVIYGLYGLMVIYVIYGLISKTTFLLVKILSREGGNRNVASSAEEESLNWLAWSRKRLC